MIEGTVEPLTWIVGSVVGFVVGMVAVAIWRRWLCRRCRLEPNRAGDPVARRLRKVNGQIGATQQRKYRKRTDSRLPVVQFMHGATIGNAEQLETDGRKVVTPTPNTVDDEHRSAFRFEVRAKTLFFWTLDPATAAPLVFLETIDVNTVRHEVTELHEWFELDRDVVLFVMTQAPKGIPEAGAWAVPIDVLLDRLTDQADRAA